MAFDPLTLTDLGADQIVTEATMLALYNNPLEIAQRGVGAPWLNGVGALVSLPVGSGNWVVPAGVYRVKATVCGAGGGTVAGGSSTFGGLGGGGGAAKIISTSAPPGGGGIATGGDMNISGSSGVAYGGIYPGFLFHSAGGSSSVGGMVGHGDAAVTVGVSGGNPTWVRGGGGGGTAIKVLSVNPGDVMPYTVAASPHGGIGAVVLEY